MPPGAFNKKAKVHGIQLTWCLELPRGIALRLVPPRGGHDALECLIRGHAGDVPDLPIDVSKYQIVRRFLDILIFFSCSRVFVWVCVNAPEKPGTSFWRYLLLRTQTRCLEENEEKHGRERKTRSKKETNREAPMASLRITQKS